MSQVTTCDHVLNKPAGILDEEKGLYRSQTGVTMSPELFEKVITQHHIHPFNPPLFLEANPAATINERLSGHQAEI